MNGAILPDPIELVALDPARNIWRRYSITASFDLFGMIVVETRWGRIGASGQAQRHAFSDLMRPSTHSSYSGCLSKPNYNYSSIIIQAGGKPAPIPQA